MNGNIRLFVEKLRTDRALQVRLMEAQDLDEAYAAASAVQEGFTKEELVEAMKELRNGFAAEQSEVEELTKEDLDAVAGGISDEQAAAAAGASGALAV